MIQLKEKDNWEWKPLKYIFNYFLSSVDRKIKDEELNVHICHYPDVYKNEKISDKDTLNKGTCTEFELENFKLMKGDILITKDSEDPKDIGIPCLVENDLIDSVCGYHIGILRTNENIEREFYFRYIQSTDVKDYFFCESNGITRFGLGKSSVENLKIPILSIQEQKIISQYLDKKIQTIDNLIKKIEKKIELLKEKKITLINQCVTKGLKQNVEMKDSGVEWIGEIPKHWIISRIKFHSDVLIGLSFDKDDISEEGKGTLALRSSNVQDGKVSFRDNIWVKTRVPEKLRIKNGDILVCSRNGSRKLIGKNCILGNESVGMTWGVFMTVLRTSSPKFFYWILNSQLFKSQSGIYLTSTINQLTVSTLQNMVIPYPPDLNEQNEINIFLEKVSGEINQVLFKEEKRINLLKEYRQSLITSVVTGKKRVV